MPSISGSTRLVGIIGCPVRHSLSPAMHNAAFAECRLDYAYVPFAVTPEKLEKAVSGLNALGVCGFNVTIPHKVAIIPFLDSLDQSAQAAGAVNTVLIRDGRTIGYNTDGGGLVTALEQDLEYTPGNGSVLIIGAGGAARGAIAALSRRGAHRILVVNRTFENACTLVDDIHQGHSGGVVEAVQPKQLDEQFLSSVSLIINTTSAGMNNDRIDFIDLAKFPKSVKVFDMVYSPPVTPLLLEAESLGFRGVNGLGMLAAQGELAFTIWTGQIPPFGLMKRVAQGFCTAYLQLDKHRQSS